MIEKIKDFFYDLYSVIFSYKEMIQRMLFWAWNLRWNYDFDGTYLYKIIYLKIDRMYKYFKDHGHCMWTNNINNNQMRKLRIARECAKRLYKDKYTINAIDEMDKKWGKLNIDYERFKYITEQDKINERKDNIRIHDKYEKIKNNDKRLLFGILEKHLEGFWD